MKIEGIGKGIFQSMAIALLFACVARADKLNDLGLDREGKPMVESTIDRGPVVFLQSERGLVAVERSAAELKKATDTRSHAMRIAEWVIRGSMGAEKAEGLISAFTEGSRLADVRPGQEGRLVILAELPEGFLEDSARVEMQFEPMHRALEKSLFLQMPEVRSVQLLVRDPARGDYVPLARFLPPDNYEPVVPIPDDATAPLIEDSDPGAKTSNQPVRTGSGRPSGALSGKAVYLNPGHGYVYRPTSESWGLQRGFVHNNIEDFSNVDSINQWLFAYCHNAGADVFSVREEDQNFNMVIVDNDDGGPNYVETGSGWSTSSLAGFANGRAPYIDGQDPFSYGTNRLLQCTVGAPTASASWIPTIPQAGWYHVYVSHAAFTNRSPQAHYRVYHAGGETDFYLDQRMRRFTWIFIGSYYFEAGRNPESGKVMLFNDSSSSTHYLSADAVRFGGGIGLISRGNAGTSGRVRCDEDARYHLQFNGAPTSVYDPSTSTDNQMDERDGWTGRPRFGRWLKEQAQAYGASAQDSVFISSHTNAGGGTGLGTFIYTGQAGTWHDDFRNAVHDEVLNDLSRGYSANFRNHGTGKKEGTYGENSPTNVGNLMPIFLGEWLFHDSATDMAMYHDPKFRQIMARAIYQGIVKFWAARNGTAVNLLPEPPRNFRCRAIGQDRVQLDWVAPETDAQGIRGQAATGYKIYRSLHGKGFPAGLQIGNMTTHTVTGLEPGKVYYFRLSATNAGGESFPTEVLAVKTPSAGGEARLLLVNGFDKMDTSTRIWDSYGGGVLYRQNVNRMNTFDYLVEHARAIDTYSGNVSFDSCEDEALNLFSLSDYDAVVWLGGIQAEVSTTDPTVDYSLTTEARTLLTNYLASGGSLFISGSEIAWDLDRGGTTSFVDTSLKANYVADDAETNAARGAAGSIFAAVEPFAFGDETNGTYPVLWPDLIAPVGGSISALEYTESAGGVTILDGFNDLGGWKDPNYSSQTNADAASTFSISTTIKREGSGSGDLYYVWGTGSFIREYNSSLPAFPSASVFSIWVYGDQSGHQVRICLRDSDNDLFVNNYTVIDFTGWRQMTWDLRTDPVNVWVQSGNGVIDGPSVRLDSIQIQKVSTVASGHLYFDEAAYLAEAGEPGSGPVAAVQYDGDYRLIYLAFPFETIADSSVQNQIMEASLDFLLEGVEQSVANWEMR